MQIEVCKQRLYRNDRVVRNDLTVFLDEGQAFACWAQEPVRIRKSRRIWVSNELAIQALGAELGPCPHVGKAPVYKWAGGISGYTSTDHTEIGGADCYTVVRCHTCGHYDRVRGNPRLGYAGPQHPIALYLHGGKKTAIITEADWDTSGQMLVPANRRGKLVVALPSLSMRASGQLMWEIRTNFQEASRS